MNRQVLSAALALAFAATGTAPAFAHGGHEHVMGTVKSVDAQGGKLEVATKAGKVVAVVLNDKTKYMRGTAVVAVKDMAVGERVVVDAAPENGQLVAREIKLRVLNSEPAPEK
jgi:hypothetical protein